MEEKIVSNMTELSEAAEQKFKDIVNNNVTENPEGPNKINEPNTELPATGSIPDKSVTVDNPFKTDAGILGDNAKLVNPEVKEPTPDTPQEKAVSGVTDETAAIYVDAKISDAGDGSDNFEEAIKKTEEELDKALQESEGDGNPTFTANGSDSSMDGSSDTGDKEDTGSSDEATDSNIAETGDNGDTAGDKIPDEIGSESDEGDNLEEDEKKDEAPVVEEEIKDEVKDEGETPTEGPSNATSDEVGDIHEPPKIVENATEEGSDKIETDIDLAGTEFEKNVKEFDNIVKLENTDDLGKAYTDESNIVTSGLDEMAAHAESVRAAMKEMGQAGFEGAMINVHTNLSGMEAATSTKDTFDPNGQLFEDIFKNFPK